VSIELLAADSPAVIEVSAGRIHTRLGTAAKPDVILDGEPRIILALFAGALSAAQAAEAGLEIRGDISALERVLPPPADRADDELGHTVGRTRA
jgi:hypothetical protein